jgi:cyclopropane fatty-acyl-phospholipid synthase-like methyltransferase
LPGRLLFIILNPDISSNGGKMTALSFAPASDRNKQPILDVLVEVLPSQGRILEIGSGTGQHVVFFAPRFPALGWQPTERNGQLQDLSERIRHEGSANILQPLELDVLAEWPDQRYEAAYSANTAHIMSWEAVCAMFSGVGERLRPGGVFCLYGPFNEGGEYTADSNEAFDVKLKSEDSQMGLRDVGRLESLAREHSMEKVQQIQMPANNQVLVFRKTRTA